MQERRTIHYSGRVQGVGFRWTVVQTLRGAPIGGFVRNLADGRVQLVLEGDPGDVEAAAARVRRALARHIDGEEAETATATGEFDGFGVAR